MNRIAALLELDAALPPPPRPRALSFAVQLAAMDKRLVAAGFHPISPWWRRTLEAFFATGRKRLVARVGRRGGKGVTMARVAVLMALHGNFSLPPGEVGMFAFVSVDRKEAAERIRNIKAILSALEEPYEERLGDLQLIRRPILFRVLTASIAGVSGPTCIGAVCDELSKWRDAKTGANPATEVLASLRPTMVTQPSARMFLVSSPLGQMDAHAAAYAEGDTATQMVVAAPSWEANPTITEAATHAEEPNEDVWRREYAAIPLEGTEESLFSSVMLDRAERANADDVPWQSGVTYNAAMDPALVRNAWTLAITARRVVYRPGPRIVKSVVAIREWRGTTQKPLRARSVLAEVAQVCRRYRIEVVDTDEFHGQSLQEIAELPEIGLIVRVLPTVATEKIERYEQLLAKLSDDEIELPKHKQLRADLLAVRRVLTPNGFVIRLPETPDGRHCDHASSVTLALQNCRVEPEEQVLVAPFGTPEYYGQEQQRLLDQMQRSWERKQQEGW